jgi:hypothetical protein
LEVLHRSLGLNITDDSRQKEAYHKDLFSLRIFHSPLVGNLLKKEAIKPKTKILKKEVVPSSVKIITQIILHPYQLHLKPN